MSQPGFEILCAVDEVVMPPGQVLADDNYYYQEYECPECGITIRTKADKVLVELEGRLHESTPLES